ncbi:MAG: hypothetical protein AAF492_16285 [Verrucomicrobiota bacterium]
MIIDKAQYVAEAIITDTHGAGFYQDEAIMAGFIKEKMEVDIEVATDAAKTIVADFAGDKALMDQKALIDLLKEKAGA